ncbi:MAG TPA: OB-fold nucleic acid binding domain-containing protein, partial [Bradyrhizobium sp.]|nr:OB-fold nucleic acid binding domain-containing protein [Bradyrhizobium sp.]
MFFRHFSGLCAAFWQASLGARIRLPRRFVSGKPSTSLRGGLWPPIRSSDHLFQDIMHRYRSHTCGALRDSHIDQTVRLSGWCHRIRDHGGLLFIDLRDHYGLTQCVVDPDSAAFKDAEKLRSEWVVRID